MSHDGLELGMNVAGLLMALAPIVFAGIVLGVWWYGRKKTSKEVDER